MFDTLLELVKKEQTKLIQIYLGEREKKGEGLMLIYKDNNKADIRYYLPDKTPYPEIDEEYKNKKDMKGDTIKVENKWIVTLPILELETDVTIPVWNLILDDSKNQVFFQGFPQEVKLEDGKVGLQYVLVAEPHLSTIAKNNWTVEATTNGQNYLEVCKKSSMNYHSFLTFRSDSRFCKIIIPGKKEDGDKILERIKDTELINKLDEFRKNDEIGCPITYNYGKYGYFSPNTLRYVNTLYELQESFPDMKDWSVVEFGGGYGGLCNILSCIGFKSYDFLEIPETLELAKKTFMYSKLDINCVSEGLEDKKYDLFISEFAFCELNEEGIEKYTYLLENSKRAYLSMNLWDTNKKEKLKKRLLTTFSSVEEYPVFIKSEWGDYVWICK
jgi:hypothetical protein